MWAKNVMDQDASESIHCILYLVVLYLALCRWDSALTSVLTCVMGSSVEVLRAVNIASRVPTTGVIARQRLNLGSSGNVETLLVLQDYH